MDIAHQDDDLVGRMARLKRAARHGPVAHAVPPVRLEQVEIILTKVQRNDIDGLALGSPHPRSVQGIKNGLARAPVPAGPEGRGQKRGARFAPARAVEKRVQPVLIVR